MCNQPLTTMMMNNDYGDHDDSEMTIMLSSQFVKWLRGGLGLLFGIVALRALEARYLPPCPLVPHCPADFTSLSFSPNLMAIMLKIIMIMIMIMITLCLGHQQCFLILRQTFSCVGIVSFPNPHAIESVVSLFNSE